MPVHASELYAKNVLNLVNLMIKDGVLSDNLDDEVVKGCLLTHQGDVTHERGQALFPTQGGVA